MGLRRGEDLFELEQAVWLWTARIGVPIYDFAFEPLLACRRPYQRPEEVEAVARVGALDDYAGTYEELRAEGIRLIHSPEAYRRATRLPEWYPLLEDLTPKSLWFSEAPDPSVVGEALGWPIFMKGARQTSRHKRQLSIIAGPDELRRALDAYAQDPILAWQEVVCRALAPLRPVEDPDPERIPSSFEFRSFWWRGELAGVGRYWWEGVDYALGAEERAAALAVAREAARRVDVAFLVVDVAQRVDGRWIVIECNDGQESGYAGVSPLALWQEVVRLERARLA
ncbi:MAG: ATP-grasp domain-containing protein [Planctomycetota bacterium]